MSTDTFPISFKCPGCLSPAFVYAQLLPRVAACSQKLQQGAGLTQPCLQLGPVLPAQTLVRRLNSAFTECNYRQRIGNEIMCKLPGTALKTTSWSTCPDHSTGLSEQNLEAPGPAAEELWLSPPPCSKQCSAKQSSRSRAVVVACRGAVLSPVSQECKLLMNRKFLEFMLS